MPRRTLATALVIPALLLFALTACTAGGSGDDGSGSGSGNGSGDGDDSAGGQPTACVEGDWSADLQDLAAQMLEQMTSGGSPITSVEATGTQELSIDHEGFLGFGNSMAFITTADLGNGLVMTVTQTHAGGVGADWAWDGDAEGSVMVFDNFNDSEYTINTVVAINGTASDQQFPTPDVAAGNVPLAVTCTGDVMTTKAAESPFTTTWHRQ
jgi:hypothetical protein